MIVNRKLLPLLLVNALVILFFTFLFLKQENYEFIIYIIIVLFFGLVVFVSHKHIQYPTSILWGLSLWAFLHMAGGGIIVNGAVLYKYMLAHWIGEPFNILKYDQVIHVYGFFITTLVSYYLIKPFLSKKTSFLRLAIVLTMAGLGFGALNEIVEFIATVTVPETNVGGYTNTSLDLVADLIGALLALVIIWKKEHIIDLRSR
jgi:hypothetical protein